MMLVWLIVVRRDSGEWERRREVEGPPRSGETTQRTGLTHSRVRSLSLSPLPSHTHTNTHTDSLKTSLELQVFFCACREGCFGAESGITSSRQFDIWCVLFFLWLCFFLFTLSLLRSRQLSLALCSLPALRWFWWGRATLAAAAAEAATLVVHEAAPTTPAGLPACLQISPTVHSILPCSSSSSSLPTFPPTSVLVDWVSCCQG